MYSCFINFDSYIYFIVINLKLLSFITYRVFQKFNLLWNSKKEIIDIDSYFAATFISTKNLFEHKNAANAVILSPIVLMN